MKKIIITSSLVFLTAISGLSYASTKYQQRIQLSVTGNKASKICFKTTDVFDKKHCGSSAHNNYDKGPKNYYLELSNSDTLKFDGTSCQAYFDKGSTQRTPDEKGTEIISLIANGDSGSITVSNCQPDFLPSNL